MMPRDKKRPRRTLHVPVRVSIVPTDSCWLIAIENAASDVVLVQIAAEQAASIADRGLVAHVVARVRVAEESGTRAVDTWGKPR